MRSHWPPRLIAAAFIETDGTVFRSVGIESVTQPGTGNYDIVLQSTFQDSRNLFVAVAPFAAGGAGNPGWSWNDVGSPGNEIVVGFLDAGGVAADAAFSLRVYRDE